MKNEWFYENQQILKTDSLQKDIKKVLRGQIILAKPWILYLFDTRLIWGQECNQKVIILKTTYLVKKYSRLTRRLGREVHDVYEL